MRPIRREVGGGIAQSGWSLMSKIALFYFYLLIVLSFSVLCAIIMLLNDNFKFSSQIIDNSAYRVLSYMIILTET